MGERIEGMGERGEWRRNRGSREEENDGKEGEGKVTHSAFMKDHVSVMSMVK